MDYIHGILNACRFQQNESGKFDRNDRAAFVGAPDKTSETDRSSFSLGSIEMTLELVDKHIFECCVD